MSCTKPAGIALIIPVLALLYLPAAQRAWAQTAATASQSSEGEQCDRAHFHLLLDVGHTAKVPGADSARGVPEFKFNLRLALETDDAMIGAGFSKTQVLVTEGPKQIGLSRRVARANHLAPDVLLSIHHDSVPDKFLEKWEYEGKKSYFSDRFKGHSIFVSWDNPAREMSLHFARLLGLQLKERGLTYTPHYTEGFMGRFQRKLVDPEAGVYRYDQLRVLRETQMPAVLLEAGSIINRDEELLMDSVERRGLISAAVVDTADAYCAAPPRRQARHAKQ
jgi:N-acetylmuramoyl-L-alanine amidase